MALSCNLMPRAAGVFSLVLLTSGCVSPDTSQPIDSKPIAYYRKPPPPSPFRSKQPRPRARHEARRVTSPPNRRASRNRAEWLPDSRRISSRWRTIVIHHSATRSGGASVFDKFHREKRGWDELGYHFVIGNGTSTPDGMVEVGPRWRKQKHGAHCKTPNNYYNEHGIGICLVGDFTTGRPTAKQMAALDDLLRYLCSSAHIPVSRITSHGEINRKTKCPGRYFPMAKLRRALVLTPPAGPHRADAGATEPEFHAPAAVSLGEPLLATAETIGSAKLQPILGRSVSN